jgi:hypothetical protein
VRLAVVYVQDNITILPFTLLHIFAARFFHFQQGMVVCRFDASLSIVDSAILLEAVVLKKSD